MSKAICDFCKTEFKRRGRPKNHNFCCKKHFNAWNSKRISEYNSTENPMNSKESWTAKRRAEFRKSRLKEGSSKAYKKVYGKLMAIRQ